MYNRSMTIKKRLFFSNIRMLFLSIVALMCVGSLLQFFIFGAARPGTEEWMVLQDAFGRDERITIWVLFLIISILFVSLINNFFTQRMIKNITSPLELLNGGVRQIHANNFACRIDYKGNDEFHPICEAFNEMAEKLETSTAQRKKDEGNRRELIAGISHDLRTPLTSIKGCLEGIETGVASTPEMREKYLSIIKTKTAAMEHIIEQLFLFSKLDMDDFPLDMRRTDVALAVCDMIEDSMSEYAAKGLAIKLADMPKNIYILADVLMLRNVIINILENSVKYKTKEQGQVEVSAALKNDDILLRLTDDGPGVQPDMLPKLFGVFYRADPSRTKLGSGLGLAISAKIVERMGGSIRAELSPTGGLATVIRLPLASSAAMGEAR